MSCFSNKCHKIIILHYSVPAFDAPLKIYPKKSNSVNSSFFVLPLSLQDIIPVYILQTFPLHCELPPLPYSRCPYSLICRKTCISKAVPYTCALSALIPLPPIAAQTGMKNAAYAFFQKFVKHVDTVMIIGLRSLLPQNHFST